MRRPTFLLALALAALCSAAKLERARLTLDFTLDDAGRPTWQLFFDGKPVVYPSHLGIELAPTKHASKGMRETSLTEGFQLMEVHTSQFAEQWAPVWGEEDSITNAYSEMRVALLQPQTQRKMDIVFRLFDEGVALRYECPLQVALVFFVISEERTKFALGQDMSAWWIPGDYDTQEYETHESRLSEIPLLMQEAITPNSSQTPFSETGVQTALQLRRDDGLYLNIHEAALVDYSTMHLQLLLPAFTFESHLTPDATGMKGYMQTPMRTPWRTLMVTDDARQILSSRMALNLNEPCRIEDTSWIHPVKYCGVWWEMIVGKSQWSYTDELPAVDLRTVDYTKLKPHGHHGANTDNVRRYIDFAARNGLDEVLVEGWNIGWEDWFGHYKEYVFDFLTPYPDFDLQALNAYARERGVRLMMHHETSGAVPNYERHLLRAYEMMRQLGYDAVKSGYVGDVMPRGEHHYSQTLNQHYLRCVELAADHHIMVNAHEATRPTGLSRTWPNLVGNESARGTEYEAFGGSEPYHTVILPFTRLQGGPMDYTPGVMVTRLNTWSDNDSWVRSTLVGQLALYLTLYSPLQMLADLPEHYELYADAFEFIRRVPVDWSQSIYLAAEPARYVTVARREKHTPNWFVGDKCGAEGHEITIPLTFLDPTLTYECTIYSDPPEAPFEHAPDRYVVEQRTERSTDSLTIKSAPGGGCAISLIAQ